MPSEATRAWLYRVSLVVIPALAAWGVIGDADVALWVAIAGAVLNSGLAAANTSTAPSE